MRRTFSRFCLCLLCSLFVACELPTEGGEGSPLGEPESLEGFLMGLQQLGSEAQEMAKPNQVEAWVDKLAVKAQPGEDMPTIARLAEGQVVEYLYQRTVRKSTFTLRGQSYKQAWILVKLPDERMGWVHEGGIRYVGPEFSDFLNPDDPNNPYTQSRSLNQNQGQTARTTGEWTIVPGKRVGPITLTTSEADLIQQFGAAYVTRGEVDVASGQREACTIVMPNSADELRITWKSEERDRVKAIYLTKPQSKWHLFSGIRVGMPLLDVTKANESPVSFYGFDWEYSGTVSSWRNGRMRKYDKYFYMVLTPVGASNSTLAPFRGNQVFSSNTKGVEALNLHVERLVIYLD